MHKEFDLSGDQRNYRKPGKRLLPRDAYTAHECSRHGLSKRALYREHAIEAAAYGERPERDAWELKFEREFESLPKRLNKRVVKALDAKQPPTTARLRRAYNAAVEYDQIIKCIEHDARMLRNCY